MADMFSCLLILTKFTRPSACEYSIFDLYLLGFCLYCLWLVKQALQHGFLGLVNMFHPKFAGPAAS